MGRGIKLYRYDPFLEEETVQTLKDDRRVIDRAKTVQEIEKYLSKERRGGVIYDQVYRAKLVKRDGNKIKVDDEAVKKRAKYLADTVTNQRFEPLKQYNKQHQELAREQGITVKQAKNLSARDSQVEAKAVLAAAKVGKVKLSSYEVGILNKLAAGRYEDAVYGDADVDGRRRYQRGTYFTQLGFDKREKQKQRGYRGETTEARRDEQRRNFLEYTGGGGGGRITLKPFS